MTRRIFLITIFTVILQSNLCYSHLVQKHRMILWVDDTEREFAYFSNWLHQYDNDFCYIIINV